MAPKTNELALMKTQVGIEVPASRGVAVAATNIIPARGVVQYNRPLSHLPEQSGRFNPRGTPVYGRMNAGMTMTVGMAYEDTPLFYRGGIKGAVVGVGDAGTPEAFVHAFTPTDDEDDLDSFTFEVGEPGNVYEMAQAMVNSWTIRGDGDSTDEPGWMMELEYLARSFDPSSYTAALTTIDREAIMAAGTKVYIDNGGAAFGTTQVTGKVINFSVTQNLGLHLKGFLEDELSYGAGNVGRGDRLVDAQFTFEFDDDDEFANYRASTPVERKIRLEREGSTIHTIVKNRARLDLAGYWSSWSPGDREGNMIATFGFAAYIDDILGYDFAAEIVNSIEDITAP